MRPVGGIPHALAFDESGPGRWLWISPVDRSDLVREAESWPPPEEIDMERVMAIFRKHATEFLEEHEG